jgi:hypothetical protein
MKVRKRKCSPRLVKEDPLANGCFRSLVVGL